MANLPFQVLGILHPNYRFVSIYFTADSGVKELKNGL